MVVRVHDVRMHLHAERIKQVRNILKQVAYDLDFLCSETIPGKTCGQIAANRPSLHDAVRRSELSDLTPRTLFPYLEQKQREPCFLLLLLPLAAAAAAAAACQCYCAVALLHCCS